MPRPPASKIKVIDGSYRVSRVPEGLRIEVLDYHAGPALMGERELRELGFAPVAGGGQHVSPQRSAPPPDRDTRVS